MILPACPVGIGSVNSVLVAVVTRKISVGCTITCPLATLVFNFKAPPNIAMPVVVRLPIEAPPVTVILLNVLTLVILAMVPSESVPLKVPPAIVPETVRFDNVPSVVMEDCAPGDRLPLSVVAETVPDTVRPFNMPTEVILV